MMRRLSRPFRFLPAPSLVLATWLCLAAMPLQAYDWPTPAAHVTTPAVTLVVVEKSQKRLLLLRDDEVLREYPIALGFNPVGHKQEEGDGRTPEGRYQLDWRNPESRFYRSIHVSYPNERDMSFAEAHNRDPGGHIMIHGRPEWAPSDEWASKWLYRENWTEGCIAVTNRAMDEIWMAVEDGTPIEIRP